MREFETGATRDTDEGKYDYEGFLSPLVIERYGAYMDANRYCGDHVRDSDDWQRGIPRDVYMKSAWRHFLDLWMLHRGFASREGIGEEAWDAAICGLLFNVMGYFHEVLKERVKRGGR